MCITKTIPCGLTGRFVVSVSGLDPVRMPWRSSNRNTGLFPSVLNEVGPWKNHVLTVPISTNQTNAAGVVLSGGSGSFGHGIKPV